MGLVPFDQYFGTNVNYSVRRLLLLLNQPIWYYHFPCLSPWLPYDFLAQERRTCTWWMYGMRIVDTDVLNVSSSSRFWLGSCTVSNTCHGANHYHRHVFRPSILRYPLTQLLLQLDMDEEEEKEEEHACRNLAVLLPPSSRHTGMASRAYARARLDISRFLWLLIPSPLSILMRRIRLEWNAMCTAASHITWCHLRTI